MTDSAFAANQTNRVTSILLNEAESGNSNKAPRLANLDEYPHWKDRFEIHLNGVETNLWGMIENFYVRPINGNGETIPLGQLTDVQRKEYDNEKRAYAILTQCISKEIFHQFRQHKTTKALWDALEQRYEGNASLKKIKAKTLKKEFDSFLHIGNETLEALITRYYHLLSELYAHQAITTMEEKVTCLADALPPKWESFLMVLR